MLPTLDDIDRDRTQGSIEGVRHEGTSALPAALPATLLAHLTLETTRATALYWTGVGFVAASVFLSKLLPCVDYAQHLALSDLAARLTNPAAPEHAGFTLNYFTYNALFHFLVAKLSVVLPIELSGRVVVSASLVILGGAVVALMRVIGRPPSYAALFTPVLFSFSVGWGFVNYALGTAIFVCALVVVARSLLRPTLLHAVLLAGVALLCAFAHVLAMILLCVMAASIAPELAWRGTADSRASRARHTLRALGRMVIALAPILVGCAFCIKVYLVQYDWDPNMYRDPTLEGTMPPIWQKLALYSAYATNLHSDRSDQAFVWASVLVILVAAYVAIAALSRGAEASVASAANARAAGPDPGALVLPVAAMFAAYLATPMVLIGTHLIFPRLAQPLLLAAVLAMPRLAPLVRASPSTPSRSASPRPSTSTRIAWSSPPRATTRRARSTISPRTAGRPPSFTTRARSPFATERSCTSPPNMPRANTVSGPSRSPAISPSRCASFPEGSPRGRSEGGSSPRATTTRAANTLARTTSSS